MANRCGFLSRRTLLLAAALAWSVAVGAAAPEAIVGAWLTEDGASRIEISRARGADGAEVFSGKVVWLREPAIGGKPVLDASNSDASLRGRTIMGLEILSGFRYTADGAWTGGTVYSPRRGRSYPAELKLTPDGRLDLKVNAGLVSSHQFWTR